MSFAAAHHRRRLAVVCIVAAIAGQVVLPAMHAVVHGLEAAVARAKAERWRVEGGQRERQRQSVHVNDHDHDHDRDHDGRGGHRHPGDGNGEHGAQAPEHLAAVLVPSVPVLVVPPAIRFERVDMVAREGRVHGHVRARADEIRGPPGTV